MICPDNENTDILVVSENGYGKRSKLDDYRITNRGGKGVKTINVTDKTGPLISIDSVTDNDDLMIINRSGLIIRLAVAELRIMGRATQGVRLINLRDNDSIAAVTKVEVDQEEEAELLGDTEQIDGTEFISDEIVTSESELEELPEEPDTDDSDEEDILESEDDEFLDDFDKDDEDDEDGPEIV
jgi:DNA gyrase subunit A